MKKVLVTGATGNVGSRFVPRLIKKGYDVHILVRHAISSAATIVIGDLNDAATLPAAVAGMDAVIHIAASYDPVNDTNLSGTLSLANAAIKAGVQRFVFVSTAKVYRPDYGRPAREDDPLATHEDNAYFAGKIAAEQALLSLNIDVRILRLGFVYGDGDAHLARMKGDFHPDAKLHMVHHRDVAQALILLLEMDGLNGEVFNLGDDAPVSFRELGLATSIKGPLKYPFEGVMDTSKILKRTGLKLFVPGYNKE